MLLKKIKLNNIRSYENQEITFPVGSTLLSGDIGSGKTSILLAIEFALFGLQPTQRGSSLLRNGTLFGGVEMDFEVDGREITVERTLKKNKAISQDYCSITIDGGKKEISVMELKNIILDLLNYPEEFSKKQNLLYKFTVYTPQEEMKQIILQDSETRVNTLRHVFGIDRYKTILNNIALLTSKLREEKRIKEGIISNIDEQKLLLNKKENELEAKHYNLTSIEKEFFTRQEERNKIREERERILEKVEEGKKIYQDIEKNKIIISGKMESFNNNQKIINKLKEQIKEVQEKSFSESEMIILEGKIGAKKIEKEGMNNEIISILSEVSLLNKKNTENSLLKSKISEIYVCPTCLQEVRDNYKDNIIKKLNYELHEDNKKIAELEDSKKNLSDKLKIFNREVAELERNIQEMRILKLKNEEVKDKISHIEELEQINENIKKEVETSENLLLSLGKSFLDYKKFGIEFEEKNIQLEAALKMERFAEIKVAELKKEIDFFSRQVEELKEKIKETEKIQSQINYISEVENWLSQNFSVLISIIEKNVMIKLRMEFSKFFSQWFGMLVSETFNVRVSDDFTPVIEQQDYELDYNYMSGGERTAIALAYRLALNQVINSLLSKIKTKDVVILDEPTDGFSDKQLDKMRDVLNQLNIKQLIIVSHEQKIEAFVENIIKFKKENGISKVEF
ncbi:MAG: hypothetical protein A2639_00455 [Candidatus Staskawiczbacteria bacterium RIFCSPHIGHO2_01_FULL_34_27]|uniref:Rad50/SbcC-type AAA domain-containing protein n=1 Tax=Candidatus Staskawiczbacteria bacterium RIFCSPHIGHO2_01_FULL_34_27 TaxID=1802199 RepID=A0A1G2HJZ4_9BACT|nr:hypothetical protein [Candidatus Pacearchaeota archaeon]OGZ62541.1 MAG: hypothetical protein A2639_00455 [Candidatus Staskawiczbacteria bacterium RIFCSPHIGHO2_01_FULL_34_27]